LREWLAKFRRASPLVRAGFPSVRGKLLLLRGKLPQRRGNRPLLREGMTPTWGNSAPVRGN